MVRQRQSLLKVFGELRARSRLVDLAPRLHSNMPQMTVHPGISIVHDARNHRQHGYYLQTLLMTEHHGAHADAPIHADPGAATIEEVALDQLIAPFKKYDLGRLDPQPGQLIAREQLLAEERRAGFELEPGDVALLDFGWSRFYLPDEPDWAKRRYWADFTPGLAEDACEYLASRQVNAVCSDTVACDISVVAGEIQSEFGHRTYFLPNGILIGESFQNLELIPATGILLALPLRIERGSGSPLRPVALVEP